jgi:hypothetical protein
MNSVSYQGLRKVSLPRSVRSKSLTRVGHHHDTGAALVWECVDDPALKLDSSTLLVWTLPALELILQLMKFSRR